jgi:SAM-dependent methyltransferase
MKSNYGQSSHYEGAAGERYFTLYNQKGALLGKLNAWKFAPFIKPSDNVLDFGCGGGWLLRELSCRNKYGIEPNPAARSCCSSLGIEVFPSVEELPGNLQFDVIISHHALEHVPYPIQALKELRLKLRHNGRLVVVIPLDDWRVQLDFTGQDLDHHLHTWTPRLFANSLREPGFRTECAKIITDAWPPKVEKLSKMPAPIFKFICHIWSLLRRWRQLLMVAVPITA